MPRRQRASIRLWQTMLFIVVIVVAMLILSGSLSAGARATLSEMAMRAELRNASALAGRLGEEFPISAASTERVRRVLAEYRGIYGGGVWIYARDGSLLMFASEDGPTDAELENAKVGGLADDPPYASIDLKSDGWAVAAKPIRGPGGTREAVVVTASSVEDPLAILDSIRSRLWVTFWISLAVAGLLGFGFSQIMARRIKGMSDAAVAIAGGDFDQRLPTGFIPDEVYDLAESYNSMAVKLGEAFGALQESQRQISAVVESMAEGVVAFDSNGVVQVANPEAVRLLAPAEGDLLGRSVDALENPPEVLEVVHAGLRGDRAARTVELGQHVALLHCTPLLDPAGGVDGAVLLLSDVTERHRLEDAQRRFVADASHEMRTPIAALKGMLELLADGAKDVPEVRDDFIHTMQLEADRLGRLVADLLTLARLEAGTLELKIGSESVAGLLGDVAGVLHTLAEDAEVTLAVDLPDGDLRVLADHDRVVQVLLSFTDNAIKHSPRGSSIRLRAHTREQAVLLEVSDEGAGIGEDELSRVFERFYRADQARAGGGGAGLGLAIAKEIVEAHGSSIEVTSAPGEGTTFGFALPAAPPAPGPLS